ncbi:MAG: hypothetical protein QOH93_2750 [Chloroflexia bacterium]|jgi:hypothetical protein|nr:hypothetical protein [Chloroflexia bacterium]
MDLTTVVFERIQMVPIGKTRITPPVLPQLPIGMDPVIIEKLEKGGFFTPQVAEDGAGNVFLAYVKNTGADAFVNVVKELPDGTLAPGGWEFHAANVNNIAHKGDHVGLMLRGDSLRVYLSSHGLNEGPRDMVIWRGVKTGVAIPNQKPLITAEKCVAPGNLPYFRTDGFVTRGQAAIMLLRFARWLLPFIGINKQIVAPPNRKFQDVDPGTTFFEAVQWANEAGIVGGFQCKP